MLINWRQRKARKRHQQALAHEERGEYEAAERAYREAAAIDPQRATSWYNLGLLCKYQRRWQESAQFNARALEIEPSHEAACWNLGIAATALGDWPAARAAWKRYGIDLPQGEGPIELDYGLVPVRVHYHDGAEVVWARRIDPARALIRSVPLPRCGLGYGDLVLHDGAPTGYRLLEGKEVPVFDVLDRLRISGFETFEVHLHAPAPEDVRALETLCDQAECPMEDWAQSMRYLCKACSEGRPHEHHESAPAPETSWEPQRRIGIGARDEREITQVLRAWRASHGRRYQRIERVLTRDRPALATVSHLMKPPPVDL